TAGSNTSFFFKILDPYLINQTAGVVDYDFSIIANHKPIFQKSGVTTDSDVGNTITVPIPINTTGPITIAFENLKGSSFAGAEFTSVVSNPSPVPEFPFSSMIILFITFTTIILLSKLRQFSRFFV
ncbi:MAG TPA: PEFG-CTERM sorting domain-containing protein, partial [Nitrosopumilaceae archaeon]|nr:PEFG-CTERM sorting domain-containing protein [Nitrosopumilaceae archaeon]